MPWRLASALPRMAVSTPFFRMRPLSGRRISAEDFDQRAFSLPHSHPLMSAPVRRKGSEIDITQNLDGPEPFADSAKFNDRRR